MRTYDREQLAILHDTAASTLLIIADGAPLNPDQLAQRARRDLAALCAPATGAGAAVDLVDAVSQAVNIHRTPAKIEGQQPLWVPQRTAQVLLGAVREALNNVDRHAHAQFVLIEVDAGRLSISDDGVGFDAASCTKGTGIARSIVARMDRLGATASVTSSPGLGTVVTLRWPLGTKATAPETGRQCSRTQALCDEIMPVLRSIAAGEVIDDRIRRLAAAHTRRLRALFDQAASLDNPLLDDLRDAIDAAEARGVAVDIHLGDKLSIPPATELAALTAPLMAVLAHAHGTAQLSIATFAETVVASIVCQIRPGDTAATNAAINAADGTEVETVVLDDTVWVTVRRNAKTVMHHGN